MHVNPVKFSLSRPRQAWQAALGVPLERTLRLCRRAVFTRPIIVGVECLPPEPHIAAVPFLSPLHTTNPGIATRSLP